ncbi:helix-turn-helix domain-containing protein [Actinomadura flavalba]|uniref:helix-turn-helix domain-containing protein n=1 Tax=Actinomadura flavalba TaxID=1120938 RepID=UPI0012DFB78D|nr:helix-turn-helix domain-containing protein [Actinomadura flavalba]
MTTTTGTVQRGRRKPPPVEEHPADAAVRQVVRALLAARDMTGAQLGEVMGFSAGQVYNRLKGEKAFTVAEVSQLSEIFRVPVGTFFAGAGALGLLGDTEGPPRTGDVPDAEDNKLVFIHPFYAFRRARTWDRAPARAAGSVQIQGLDSPVAVAA